MVARGEATRDATVLVPTYQRQSSLLRLLDSIDAAQPCEASVEVLVIDNALDLDERAVTEGRRLRTGVVRCSERGKSQALNEGLRHATGSVVCFLDDDVTVDSSYFVELFAGLKRWPGAAGFGGRVKPEFPSDAPTLHPLALSYVRGFAYAAHDFLEGEGEYPSGSRPCGNNMAFRRGWLEGEVFDTSTGPGAAGYRMGSGERLFRGILARGGKLVHLPLVRVNHHVRPDQLTTRWLLTRSYSYGRSLGYHGFAHHGISGAAPTLHLLGTWLVRVCRELAFGLLGKSYPRLWAQIDRKLVEGILAERLAPSTRR